jgi:hypothetical protein
MPRPIAAVWQVSSASLVAVAGPDVTVDAVKTAVELPTARVGAFTLFCSGPRLDGRIALHRSSPTAEPFAFARSDGERWVWESADGARTGIAPSLTDCLRSAHDG